MTCQGNTAAPSEEHVWVTVGSNIVCQICDVPKIPEVALWTLDLAVAMLRELETPVRHAGFALGLAGSVLMRGASMKDLDMLVYPLNGECFDIGAFRAVVKNIGWVRRAAPHVVSHEWFKQDSTDSKHVEVWRTMTGKRIDIFYLR